MIAQKIDIMVAMHQCCTARFVDDPATSVLDPHCRDRDLDNLYMIDATFLPSSIAVDPSLTIVAKAMKMANHILRSMLFG